jgi:hypothetical protein
MELDFISGKDESKVFDMFLIAAIVDMFPSLAFLLLLAYLLA